MSSVDRNRWFARFWTENPALLRLWGVAARVYFRLQSMLRPLRVGRTVFGSKLRCDIRDVVQSRIYFFCEYEHNLSRIVQDRLRAGDTFVDVGANVGYYSLLASSLVGEQGKVIAIDADPRNYGQLTANIELNDARNIVPVNMAVTAKNCLVRTRLEDVRNCGSTVAEVQPTGASEGVVGRPLEGVIGGDIGKANFIKIDIEGGEDPVLEGILGGLDSMQERLTIAAEIQEESARFVSEFERRGFTSYAITNRYDIEYYLIRSVASLGSGQSERRRVSTYEVGHVDYVFERG